MTLSKLGNVFVRRAEGGDSSAAVKEYVSMFFPAYGTWLPVSRFLNVFDTEDLFSAIYQLLNMIFMMGLNLNIETCMISADGFDCRGFAISLACLHFAYFVVNLIAWIRIGSRAKMALFNGSFGAFKSLMWALTCVNNSDSWLFELIWWSAVAFDLLEGVGRSIFASCLGIHLNDVYLPLNLDLDRERHGFI